LYSACISQSLKCWCCMMHGANTRINTLHVSDGLSVHHQKFKTVRTAIGICQTGTVACLLAETRWSSIYMFQMVFPFQTCIVLFRNKINFEKLVHLFGFTIEIYYDARPCECQICLTLSHDDTFWYVKYLSTWVWLSVGLLQWS
jgi:hypothetical protein